MNYSSIYRPQVRRSNELYQSYCNFSPRKLTTDFNTSDYSLVNHSLNRLSQTSTNFWTEQKPRTTSIKKIEEPDITLQEVASSIQRIQLNLDNYKYSNTDVKASARRFDELNEKINSHLKKIQSFLSKNNDEDISLQRKQEAEKEAFSFETPIKKQQQQNYGYLSIKSKKPQSVNPQPRKDLHRASSNHFTKYSNYVFSNQANQPLKLKQHLLQLKQDLSDRQRAISRLIGQTSFWQNVWLGPRDLSKAKTLVLDLDETLIHSSFDGRIRYSNAEPRLSCTFEFRPFLKEFLLKCNELFEIVIFTAGEETYAKTIVNRIKELCNYKIQIKRILDRKFINSAGQKDLSIIKDRELKDIIFIDNLALSFAKGQLDNGIPILEWNADNSRDKELKKIIPFLLHCVKYNDVREPIKERFNLDKFMNEIIQWDIIDSQIAHTPISGKCSF